ncbi:hypothetical protein BC962_2056 [Gillisia mitskevichiae]|uniref:Uncharacterized protein n=1 Tax=Gillisia mitskevichiae TaxID=270921 RepID=A0A495PY51_9FLAO|nr:hypothetical protein [Gillisia mitskevichiae]RKS53799.1 hypothetical protein BC962_2056 [Gillisia mitskevichiae]
MKEIYDVIKELDDIILIQPNGLTDGLVSESPHFHFVQSKVRTLKSPLWNQALINVSAKLFDLDISDIDVDSDNLYHHLRDFDFNYLNVLSKYYLNIDLDDYTYEENKLGHFISKKNEKINMDTICELISISISDNIKADTNFILAQLINILKEEWFSLYEVEPEDYNAEFLIADLNNLI